MDPVGAAMLVVAAVTLFLVVVAGALWERRSGGPMILLDPEQHRRGITNHRYFRDVHDSTTG